MPTAQDIAQGAHLLTGEKMLSRAGTSHVLGEEALRTVMVLGLEARPAVAEALKGFDQILERGGKSGYYCCRICTISFLRALAVAKPSNWDAVLERGLNRIRARRTFDGKWRGFPFYYTLLMLSEVDLPSARVELGHVSKAAEELLKRYRHDDRTSRFRRLGLEAALRSI